MYRELETPRAVHQLVDEVHEALNGLGRRTALLFHEIESTAASYTSYAATCVFLESPRVFTLERTARMEKICG